MHVLTVVADLQYFEDQVVHVLVALGGGSWAAVHGSRALGNARRVDVLPRRAWDRVIVPYYRLLMGRDKNKQLS